MSPLCGDGHAKVLGLLRADAELHAQLRLVREYAPRDACIGAGRVRNVVWNARVGVNELADDVDVVFFDPSDLDPGRDEALQARLQAAWPAVRWEVMNQARVHCWYRCAEGQALAPWPSLSAAIASWPETATCIAARLDAQDVLQLIAPHGLHDLLHGVLRPSPTPADPAAFAQRLAAKRWAQRWPGLRTSPHA